MISLFQKEKQKRSGYAVLEMEPRFLLAFGKHPTSEITGPALKSLTYAASICDHEESRGLLCKPGR